MCVGVGYRYICAVWLDICCSADGSIERPRRKTDGAFGVLRKERDRISISAAGRISRATLPRARGRTRCVCGVRGSVHMRHLVHVVLLDSLEQVRTDECGVLPLDGDVAVEQAAVIRSLLFIGKLKDSPTTRALIHEKSFLRRPDSPCLFSGRRERL